MNAARFEQELNGKQVRLFHISSNNISCYLTNYGARIVSLHTFNKFSKKVDVVLGFDSLEGYINAKEQYHGASVGRYANRIANGLFTLNGTPYTLAKNNGPNSLHGGVQAFHNSVWDCILEEEDKVVFELISPDMAEGFPGQLKTQITYSIHGSTVKIAYRATSTKDTIINVTHHSYFNLNGEGKGDILNHELILNSEYFTPVNDNVIPSGSLDMVADTPFDFTTKKTIGRDIESDHEQLAKGNGYDHNFVINHYIEGELNFAAGVWADKSGIKMEVWTTEPGVQFFSANHFDNSDIGKSGNNYQNRNAFCLETQHFPDSPNQSQFPSTFLAANELFESTTEYRFSIG